MARYKGKAILEILEGANNYNEWIASEISPFVAGSVLEIGAGTGNLSKYFKDLNLLTITDQDHDLVGKLRDKFKNFPKIKVQTLDIASKTLSYTNKYDTIYAVNVLEHIDNDQLALQNMYKLLNSGGRVVLLVPAKQKAYTHLDKKLGHFRRYEKQELMKKIKKAGFKVERINYFNIAGLLSWMLRDKINPDTDVLSPKHVKLFDIIVPFLKLVESIIKPPVGISLIVVGSKK